MVVEEDVLEIYKTLETTAPTSFAHKSAFNALRSYNEGLCLYTESIFELKEHNAANKLSPEQSASPPPVPHKYHAFLIRQPSNNTRAKLC